MLDRLIESKNDGAENRRLGGFLLTTATGAFFALTFALVYSLFAYNVALAGDNLMLSATITPVPIAEEKPQMEVATAAPKQQSVEKSVDKLPTRRENIQRVEETPTKVPDTVSVEKSQSQARPTTAYKFGENDLNPASSGLYTSERGGGTGAGSGKGISTSTNPSSEDAGKTAEVVPPPPPVVVKPVVKEAEPLKKITTISGGVVNGKASNLVTPVYSPAARAVRAQGEVRVAVTIDENGRVISASALGGNPLLTGAAVSAARASRFTPTLLSNQRVKVTGIIVYNFKV